MIRATLIAATLATTATADTFGRWVVEPAAADNGTVYCWLTSTNYQGSDFGMFWNEHGAMGSVLVGGPRRINARSTVSIWVDNSDFQWSRAERLDMEDVITFDALTPDLAAQFVIGRTMSIDVDGDLVGDFDFDLTGSSAAFSAFLDCAAMIVGEGA